MPWLSQKTEASLLKNLPCWKTLKFLRRVWARVLPLHTVHFGLRIKVMDPSLILGHNLMHKFLRIIFIERQEVLRNIKSALLIFGQHSRYQCSWYLGHPYDIPMISVKIDWTAPKLMPICLAISCRLLILSHMIRLCTNSTFSSVETSLTLKAPRKIASENVVCLCRLLNILADFSSLFLHTGKTVWTLIRLLLKEQSDLGPHCLQKWLLKSQADDNSNKYPKHMLHEQIRIRIRINKTRHFYISFCSLRILYKTKLILMATSSGMNVVL